MTSNRMQIWLGFGLVMLFLAGLQIVSLFSGLSGVMHGQLGDTDAFMRVLGTETLVNGGGWFNHTTMRMNAPFGDTLNWSRPIDMLLLAIAWPLHTYMEMDWHTALYWAGAASSPLMYLMLGAALMWMAAPLVPASYLPLVPLVACLQPVILAYGVPGRPDHHLLLITCAIMMMGCAVRVPNLQGYDPVRIGLNAGLWAGLGVWLSTEFQLSFIAITGVVAAMWLWQGDRRLLQFLEGCGLGFAVMVVAALWIERGEAWNATRELDKISLSQMLAACINAGVWGFLSATAMQGGRLRRILLTVLTGFVAVCAVKFFAPELLRGPTGDMDPRVLEQFFLKTREMRPLWPTTIERLGLLLLWSGLALLSIPAWLILVPRQQWARWLPLLAYAGLFTVVTFFHARFAQFSIPVTAVIFVSLMAVTGRSALRLCLIIAALVIFIAGAQLASMEGGEGGVPTKCDIQTIAPELNNLPKGIVLAAINYGPEILYFTEHDAVGGPYHRNRDGILDTYDFLYRSPTDASWEILRKRGISYVLACPEGYYKEQVLNSRLAKGEEIRGFTPIKLPEGQDFRLYRVDLKR